VFLTVATVLAGAIAVSALLSRRATLVEVHSVVTEPVRIDPGALVTPVQRQFRRTGSQVSRAFSSASLTIRIVG
jgi:hypothetical protein